MGGDKRNKENVETKPCEYCGGDIKRGKYYTDYFWNKKRYCSSGCQYKHHRRKNLEKYRELDRIKRAKERKKILPKSDKLLWDAYVKGFLK